MVVKIHPMKRETGKEENRDHVLWEDFVLMNKIKKKNPDNNRVKLNVQKNKIYTTRQDNISPTYPDKSDTVFLKNNNSKNFIEQRSRKINIEIEKNQLRRIKSGKISIEGKIDLHGFSLKESEKKLKLFVDSLRLKKRFLLVITGKEKIQNQIFMEK